MGVGGGGGTTVRSKVVGLYRLCDESSWPCVFRGTYSRRRVESVSSGEQGLAKPIDLPNRTRRSLTGWSKREAGPVSSIDGCSAWNDQGDDIDRRGRCCATTIAQGTLPRLPPLYVMEACTYFRDLGSWDTRIRRSRGGNEIQERLRCVISARPTRPANCTSMLVCGGDSSIWCLLPSRVDGLRLSLQDNMSDDEGMSHAWRHDVAPISRQERIWRGWPEIRNIPGGLLRWHQLV